MSSKIPFDPEKRHYQELVTPVDPDENTPQRKFSRGLKIEGLLKTSAWQLLDDAVSVKVAGLNESISGGSSLPLDQIRLLQGKIQGVNLLRECVAAFLEDGQAAKAELEAAIERDPQEG